MAATAGVALRGSSLSSFRRRHRIHRGPFEASRSPAETVPLEQGACLVIPGVTDQRTFMWEVRSRGARAVTTAQNLIGTRAP
jgi:hypothetical protein